MCKHVMEVIKEPMKFGNFDYVTRKIYQVSMENNLGAGDRRCHE